MPQYTVTKCICHNRSFEEIKTFARDHDIRTLEELQELKYCSCSCKMCAPYVELVLETGDTEFKPGAYY